jgi:CO/xanthine dehydrogenase FAD-binding subunit
VGSAQIRNKATFVGALCHADPASEALLLTLLFNGSVRLGSAAGVRQMKVSEFVSSPLVNAAREDEIVMDVTLPRFEGQTAFGFRCYAPRRGDYSVCSAAVLLVRASSREEVRASVVVAGIDHFPVRLKPAERILEEFCLSADAVAQAIRLCEHAYKLSDSHGSVDYGMKLSASLLAGAISDAKSRLENG